MIGKLALRNLSRNKWRSVLTAGGVAVAVGLMLWTMSFINGWMNAIVQGTTALTSLQVQIERTDYVEDSAIYHAFSLPDAFLTTLDARPDIIAATPRLNLYGLIGNEDRSQVARIIGVDPEREAAATPITRAVISGEWLTPAADDQPSSNKVVLGEGLARQLKVGVGDELVVFLEAADGSLGNDLLTVQGIVRTGNTGLDRQAAYVHLADAQFLAALDDQVHEIALRTGDPSRAEAVAAALAPSIQQADFPEPMTVRPWQAVQPQMAEMLEVSSAANWLLYLIIYLVASLGILNTQRMSALERRREFGVLLAIGVTPKLLFRIVVAETVVLGLVGALAGTVLGVALSLYHASVGINLANFSSQTSFSYLGVSFSDRIYTALDPITALQPLLVMLAVALICGLWPAVQSARLNITQALSGRS